MRYRKLTSDNDFTFGNSELDFWKDVPEAVGQSVMTRILLWLGEWFLNTDEGTPFMQGVLGKHSQAVADITLQDRILETTGVTDLDTFQSVVNPETRGFQVEATVNTIFGPTKVQVTNYANY